MKKIRILLIAFLMVLVSMFFSNTYASKTINLKAQLARPFTNSTYKFRSGSDGQDKVYTVVKIYDENDVNDNQVLLYSKPIYCLRGGVGFGAEDVSTDMVQYLESGEMHTNSASVIAKFKEYYNVDLNRTIKVNDTDVNVYNAILWILDESYLPINKQNSEGTIVYDEEKYKAELLTKVGISSEEQENITKDDLEVIQQLAIWYFTNYDEQENGDLQSVSTKTRFPAQFLSINDSNNIDFIRSENLNKIYQYFIDNAALNASLYGTEDNRTRYVEKNEFNHELNLEINSEKNGAYEVYKIGPFQIKEEDLNKRTGEVTVGVENIILIDAEGKIVEKTKEIKEIDQITGETISSSYSTVYRIIDSSTNKEVEVLKKGINYSIVFYKDFEKGSDNEIFTEDEKYNMSEVTLRLASSYSQATAEFLINTKADQPLVEINKEIISESDEINTRVKEFDLSLRKFITSINNEEVDSREPKIDTSKLNTIDERTNLKITTATYNHPKDALRVEIGDKVIYTIRIYNEGEIDGTATSVTDYLPEGLKFVLASESTVNATYGWTNPSGDGKTIITEYLKNTTIKAFDKNKTTEEAGWQKATTGEGGLYYADLKIECEVVANISGENQSLRNIAAITEDTGDDRDSVPGDPGREDYNPPADNSTYKEDDDDYENLILPGKEFDLSLRKYIISVEKLSEETSAEIELLESRNPQISTEPLKQKRTTAEYKHRKDPVVVENGTIVTYQFSVYNEGEIDGYVYSIIDYLPQGLEFDAELNKNYIMYKENYEPSELEGKDYIYKIEGNKITITSANSEYLFDKLDAFDGGDTLDSDSLVIKLKVTAKVSNEDQILTNVATMTYGPVNSNVADRDSKQERFTVPTQEQLLEDLPGYIGHNENKDELDDSDYHYRGQEDDDDFEKIVIKGKPFDLALRKYISSIKRNGEQVEFDDRTPKIDTTTLINGTFDRNGNKEYTATYEHSKEPLVVKNGDIITYTLRIYNEGERDGYAAEITDYIPEGLALILNYDTNFNNSWKLPDNLENTQIMNLIGENGFYKTEEEVKNLKVEDFEEITSLKDVVLVTGKVEITSTELNDELIKAFDKNKTTEEAGWQKAQKGEGGLYYKDIQVSCLVVAENTCKDVLTNIAEISEDKDHEGNTVTDRDSVPDNVIEKNEDDDDYEPVVLKYFDLALRKFITSVETNGKKQEITTRIPVPKMGEDGTIKYEHTKEPVFVASNDTVIYTIRVYNEGTIAGYAEEITDDIPEGLEYLPEHDTNKQYGWVMIDKDGNATEKVDEAVKITTDHLSEAKNKEENLIDPFDSSKEISTQEPLNPDYKDVKVAFKVTEPNTSDRIITNSAQISEDSDDDEDSVPGEWNEGEDDQDKEHIYVKYFDLSLLKWVTKTIVTVDGKTTTTDTGFEPNTGKTETTGIRENDEAEPIAKVEIDRKKLNKTTVKFVYKIRVTNEGEIAGYATEITDYIPGGLEFLPEDNKAFGWVKEGEDKVTTRALETVLLQPGESADVEIIFTWKRDANNLGLKSNVAEISEDYNENNSKDIDSTPDNKEEPYEEEQEDDDDFALVILSIKTGKGLSYTLFITAMLVLFASGLYLIKKYVLTY